MTRSSRDLAQVRATVMGLLASNPGRALREARQVLVGLEESVPLHEHALTLRLVAHALRANGQLEEAERSYSRAHAMLRPIDAKEAARTVIGWVQALAVLGRLSVASDLVRRTRAPLLRADPVAAARLDTNLANAQLHAGDLRSAQRSYRRAYATFCEHDRVEESTHAAFGLARSYIRTGEVLDARRWLKCARDGFGESPPPVLGAYLDSSAAIVDLLEGQRARGLNNLVSVQRRLAELEDRRSSVELQLYVTSLLVALGSAGAARRSAEQCLKASMELGNRFDAARSAMLAARACEDRGSALDFAYHLAVAAELGPEDSGLWQAKLSLMRCASDLRAGRSLAVHKQLAPLQARLDRLDPFGASIRCRMLRSQAWLAEAKPGLADRLLRRARRDARRSGYHRSRPRMALMLARCAEAQGKASSAVRWAERSVAELEEDLMDWHASSLRQEGAEARDVVHGEAAEIVLRNARRRRVERAMELVVRARSPRLIEDLLEHLPAAEHERARSLHEKLLNSQVGGEHLDPSTRTTVRPRVAEGLRVGVFASGSRSPAVVRRAWKLRSPDNWRRRLGSRTLVLFHRSAEIWRAFIIPSVGTIQTVELPQLESSIEKVWRPLRLIFEMAARLPQGRREEFLLRTHDEATASLGQLRRSIVEPLKLGARRIVIVPDGALHDLPLEALFACQDVLEVSRLPHPALLRASRRPRSASALILHGGTPGQEREAKVLRRRLRREGYNVRSSSRRQALGRCDGRLGALHLAAHGVFHRGDQHFSSIHLGDGPMGFDHLRTRSLRGALIVFSSCESGLATRRAGRDLEGWITSGFAHGVREMVLTLWKIDDAASQQFSGSFYECWLAGASAGESVAAAAREAREGGEHPYRWAAHFAAG